MVSEMNLQRPGHDAEFKKLERDWNRLKKQLSEKTPKRAELANQVKELDRKAATLEVDALLEGGSREAFLEAEKQHAAAKEDLDDLIHTIRVLEQAVEKADKRWRAALDKAREDAMPSYRQAQQEAANEVARTGEDFMRAVSELSRIENQASHDKVPGIEGIAPKVTVDYKGNLGTPGKWSDWMHRLSRHPYIEVD